MLYTNALVTTQLKMPKTLQNRIHLPFCYEVFPNSQYAICRIASRIGFICNRDTITMQGVLIESTAILYICLVLFRLSYSLFT